MARLGHHIQALLTLRALTAANRAAEMNAQMQKPPAI
jgi:hypothetical protein